LDNKNTIVALIDDDEGVRKSLSFVLELDGFIVHQFESAAALFAKLGNESIGCFIVDLCMPEASGLTLCEQLRVAGVHTPVILITAHYDAAVEDAARKLGVYRVLRKPFSGEILPRLIHAAIAEGRDSATFTPN
jgi:two-component system response regulator FixJ